MISESFLVCNQLSSWVFCSVGLLFTWDLAFILLVVWGFVCLQSRSDDLEITLWFWPFQGCTMVQDLVSWILLMFFKDWWQWRWTRVVIQDDATSTERSQKGLSGRSGNCWPGVFLGRVGLLGWAPTHISAFEFSAQRHANLTVEEARGKVNCVLHCLIMYSKCSQQKFVINGVCFGGMLQWWEGTPVGGLPRVLAAEAKARPGLASCALCGFPHRPLQPTVWCLGTMNSIRNRSPKK